VRCSGVWEFPISQLAAARFATITAALLTPENATGWRRPIGCLELQVIFRKRATNQKALLQRMTCQDKTSCCNVLYILQPLLQCTVYMHTVCSDYSHCCNVQYVLQPLLQCTKYMHPVCNDYSHCCNVLYIVLYWLHTVYIHHCCNVHKKDYSYCCNVCAVTSFFSEFAQCKDYSADCGVLFAPQRDTWHNVKQLLGLVWHRGVWKCLKSTTL